MCPCVGVVFVGFFGEIGFGVMFGGFFLFLFWGIFMAQLDDLPGLASIAGINREKERGVYMPLIQVAGELVVEEGDLVNVELFQAIDVPEGEGSFKAYKEEPKER